MTKITYDADSPPQHVRPIPPPGVGYDFTTKELVIEIEGKEVARMSPESTADFLQSIADGDALPTSGDA